MLNGTYGLFANKLFEFADYRVSELTTAFGRDTLHSMKELASSPKYGFDVIYGDTDSIFIVDAQSKAHVEAFLAEWNSAVKDVQIELVYTARKLLLRGKKHYILVTDKIISKGNEGKKSDRPPLFKK